MNIVYAALKQILFFFRDKENLEMVLFKAYNHMAFTYQNIFLGVSPIHYGKVLQTMDQ